MKKTDMHVRNSRKYFGEEMATSVIELLNSSSTESGAEEGRERIRGLIHQIRTLRKLSGKKRTAEIMGLNGDLSQYKFNLLVGIEPDGKLNSRLIPVGRLDSMYWFPREVNAVWGVIELATHNLLDKLCECKCGLHFFARFPAQHFHAEECRVRYWENSPERKERRAKRAKELYHLHKSGKVKG